MPTPRPIMANISGAKIGTFKMWLRRSSSAKPMAIPNSAVRIGRLIATTEPKAMSMMIIAPTIPAPSLGPGAAVITLPMGPPPRAM